MTRKAYLRLHVELATLRAQSVTDTSGGEGRLTARDRPSRICQLQDLITHALVGEDPPDDGIAEPGMVVTVRYDGTGTTQTLLLGLRGAEDADIEVCPPDSPLGRSITGSRPGERCSGFDEPLTLLDAVPYTKYADKTRTTPPAWRTAYQGAGAHPNPAVPASGRRGTNMIDTDRPTKLPDENDHSPANLVVKTDECTASWRLCADYVPPRGRR
jgi:transcription elongation GreA/GreB family factor